MDGHASQQQPVVGYDPHPLASKDQTRPLPRKTGAVMTGGPALNPVDASPGQPTTGTMTSTMPTTTPGRTTGTAPATGTMPATGTTPSTQVLDDMMDNPDFLGQFFQAVYAGDPDGVLAVLQKFGFNNITDADVDAIKNALARPVDQSQLRYIAGLYEINAPDNLKSIPMLISALDGSILFSNVQVLSQSIDSAHNVSWTTARPAYSYTVQFDVPYNADGSPGTPSFSGKATPAGATPAQAVPFTGTKLIPATSQDDGKPPWYSTNQANEANMFMSIASAIGISLISICNNLVQARKAVLEKRKKAEAEAMAKASEAANNLRANARRSMERAAADPANPVPDQVDPNQMIQDVAAAENAEAGQAASSSVSERKSHEVDASHQQIVVDMQVNSAAAILGNSPASVQLFAHADDVQQLSQSVGASRTSAFEADPANVPVLQSLQAEADNLGQAKQNEENAGQDMAAAAQEQQKQGNLAAAAEQEVEATQAKIAEQKANLADAQRRGDASAESAAEQAVDELQNEEAAEEAAENQAEQAENQDQAHEQNNQQEIDHDQVDEADAKNQEATTEESVSQVEWHH